MYVTFSINMGTIFVKGRVNKLVWIEDRGSDHNGIPADGEDAGDLKLCTYKL